MNPFRTTPYRRELNVNGWLATICRSCFRAASNFRSRSGWISCCRPASRSFGVMYPVALFNRTSL